MGRISNPFLMNSHCLKKKAAASSAECAGKSKNTAEYNSNKAANKTSSSYAARLFFFSENAKNDSYNTKNQTNPRSVTSKR